jgi:hypothetical protein
MRLAVVGPKRAGKSTVTNILGNLDAIFASHVYRPTTGVRVVEITGPVPSSFYDLSGDLVHRHLLPPFLEKASAIIIVWPGESVGTLTHSQIEPYLKGAACSPSSCLLLVAYLPDSQPTVQVPPLPGVASTVIVADISDHQKIGCLISEWLVRIAVHLNEPTCGGK